LTKVFFATDVHGSGTCWNKYISAGKFYDVDLIILGGDMTGKAIVPIVHQGNGIHHAALLEQEFILNGEDEVLQMAKKIKSRGYYPYRTTPEEVDTLNASADALNRLFISEAIKTLEEWLAYADEKLKGSSIRCYVCPGNDDIPELDQVIRSSRSVHLTEGEVIELDKHHEMISSGWSNPTPWNTYREEDEEKLEKRLEAMSCRLKNPKNSIFNFHVPPYGSMIDDAPHLTADLRVKYAGNALHPVGSHAVRAQIEKYQPLLGLFGHIHESRGTVRIGRTLCINPGSMYEQGSLLGALVKLGKDKIDSYVLTTG
jgi:uncharacterized protein